MKRTIAIVAILAAISLPAFAEGISNQDRIDLVIARNDTLTKRLNAYSVRIEKLTNIATKNNIRVQELEKKVTELETKLVQEHLGVSDLRKEMYEILKVGK